AGVAVHGDEAAPGWANTRHGYGASVFVLVTCLEGRIGAGAAEAGAVVKLGRAGGTAAIVRAVLALLDKADAAAFADVDEDVARLGIGSRAAPVGAAIVGQFDRRLH